MALAEHVLHEPEDHADPRCGEAEMPVDTLPEVAAHERRQERAEIDAHVVNGEPGIAAVVARRVELPDQDRDIPFEEARADHDQHQPQVKHRQDRHGHAEVAARDQDAAVQHAAALAEPAIRDPSARQRQEVDHRGVQPVHRAGGRRIEAEAARRGRRGHEQDQQGAHAVIAEALPHLGEEQRRQAAGMAEKRPVAGGSGLGRRFRRQRHAHK